MSKIVNFIYYSYKFGQIFGGNNIFKQFSLAFKNAYCVIFWELIFNKEFVFNLEFEKVKFSVYLNSVIDIHVFGEVFIDQEYFIDEHINPSIILDIGSNIGATSIYFSIKYPKSKIFSLEPNNFILDKFFKNTVSFKNIKHFKYAVSDISSKRYLNIQKNHLGSSLYLKTDKKILINTISLSDFCNIENITNIDILKFDIEGSEKVLLKDTFLKKDVSFLIGEIHLDFISQTELNEILNEISMYYKFTSKKISKERFILSGFNKESKIPFKD